MEHICSQDWERVHSLSSWTFIFALIMTGVTSLCSSLVYLLSPLLCVCVLCDHMYTCTCVLVYVETRGQTWVAYPRHQFETEPPTSLDWMIWVGLQDSQPGICLFLAPSFGTTSACHQAWILRISLRPLCFLAMPGPCRLSRDPSLHLLLWHTRHLFVTTYSPVWTWPLAQIISQADTCCLVSSFIYLTKTY